MVEHVMDEVLDYFQDRIPQKRRSEIESHLKDCTECSEAYGLGSSIREAGAHLKAERLVAIVDGVATELEQEHLNTCHECPGELDRLKSLPTFDEIPDIPDMWKTKATGEASASDDFFGATKRTGRVAKSLRKRNLATLAGLGVAASVLMLFFSPFGSNESRIQSLAQLEPIPIRTQRSAPVADALRVLLTNGIDAYQASDYEKAAEHFRQVTLEAPERADAWVLLGSSQLLMSADGLGVTALKTGRDRAATVTEEAQARWVLSQAYLALDQPEPAVAELSEVIALDTRYTDRARILLESLKGLLSQ